MNFNRLAGRVYRIRNNRFGPPVIKIGVCRFRIKNELPFGAVVPVIFNRSSLARYDSDGNENYSTEYSYDDQNRMTEQAIKSVVNGVYQTTQRTVYAYFPNDNYYEIKTFSVKQDGSEVLTYHREYFDTGRMKMQVTFDSTTGNQTYKYEYNYNGSMQYYERYGTDGTTVIARNDYVYDSLGRQIQLNEKTLVGDELKLTYRTDQTYYSNDRVKEIKRYRIEADGTETLIQHTSYHATGRVEMQTTFDQNTGKIVSRNTYDENGRQLIYQRYASDGTTVIDQREYSYNSDGKLTGEIRSVYEAGQLRTKYVTNYEYQSNGSYSKIESFTYNYNESGEQVGDPIRTGLTIYHDGSSRVKERIYYDESTGNQTRKYVYDTDGRTTLYEQYARDGQTVQARTVYSYNASGQTLEVQNYTYSSDSDSLVLTSKTVYEYYSNGRTQFVRSYSLNSSGNEVLTSEIEYYDTGRTKRSTSFNSSTGNKTYEYYYDENGRYQGNAYFDGDGNIRSKSEYVYDQDGRTKEIINSSVVDGELTVTQKTKYAYHSNGRNRQIISVKVLADGTEQLLSKTEYNSDGRTVLQESYNSSTGLISYRYTYDDSGNQTGYVRYDSEGNENYSVSYTYNESGKITELYV